jgi:hypothetical protein
MNMYTKLVLPTDEGNATTRLGGLVSGPYRATLARILLACSTNSQGLGLRLAGFIHAHHQAGLASFAHAHH